MTLTTYRNSAEENRADKSDYLIRVDQLTGDQVSLDHDISSPLIVISYPECPDFNYCHITEYRRFYFIDRILWGGENLWILTLRCDVLYTAWEKLQELTAMIARQENDYNELLYDGQYPVTADRDVVIISRTNAYSPLDDGFLQYGYSTVITTMEGS